MNKRTSQENHEERKLSRNFQRGNLPEQRKELADTLALKATKQFSEIGLKVLREELWEAFKVKKYVLNDFHGNLMYHINRKGLSTKGQNPVLLTIRKDFTFAIHLNPSKQEERESFYYTREWLDSKEFVTEIATIKQFLNDETLPAESKFKKENQTVGDMTDEEMDDFLANYEPGSVK